MGSELQQLARESANDFTFIDKEDLDLTDLEASLRSLLWTKKLEVFKICC